MDRGYSGFVFPGDSLEIKLAKRPFGEPHIVKPKMDLVRSAFSDPQGYIKWYTKEMDVMFKENFSTLTYITLARTTSNVPQS